MTCSRIGRRTGGRKKAGILNLGYQKCDKERFDALTKRGTMSKKQRERETPPVSFRRKTIIFPKRTHGESEKTCKRRDGRWGEIVSEAESDLFYRATRQTSAGPERLVIKRWSSNNLVGRRRPLKENEEKGYCRGRHRLITCDRRVHSMYTTISTFEKSKRAMWTGKESPTVRKEFAFVVKIHKNQAKSARMGREGEKGPRSHKREIETKFGCEGSRKGKSNSGSRSTEEGNFINGRGGKNHAVPKKKDSPTSPIMRLGKLSNSTP